MALQNMYEDNNKTDPAVVDHNESCNHFDGYSNKSTRCSTCKPGYASLPNAEGQCVDCGPVGSASVLVVLFAFAVVIMFVIMIALKMRTSGRKKAAHSTLKRTFLTHIQMIAIVMSLNVPWPSAVRALLIGISSVMSISSQSSST